MNYIGADLVAEALASLEVKHVFAIVSIHNMPLLDAINRLGKTKIINVRHEQAGTHAADGYARATGYIGVMIASISASLSLISFSTPITVRTSSRSSTSRLSFIVVSRM